MNSTKHHAAGWINVTHYDPKPYHETGGLKISVVDVAQEFTGGLIGIGTARFLMVTTADGTAYFTGMELFTGTLAGRSGSFVLRNMGRLKDGQVTSEWLIIPGSGTDDLTGLNGTGSTGPHGYFLDFSFD
jgi:hypothetical protein